MKRKKTREMDFYELFYREIGKVLVGEGLAKFWPQKHGVFYLKDLLVERECFWYSVSPGMEVNISL
jgi:hypothetical protein